MLKKQSLSIFTTLLCLMAIIFTILVATIDVAPAGLNNIAVGFSSVNHDIATTFPFNEFLYSFTNFWFILPLIALVLFYFGFGLYELIKRRSLKKVDREIIALGFFYLALIVVYVVFEKFLIINYRPVIIDGISEPSYPSSHTLFALCICGSAAIANAQLFKNKKLVNIVNTILLIYAITIVVLRFVSGVHWLTDILGGIIISAALIAIFYQLLSRKQR